MVTTRIHTNNFELSAILFATLTVALAVFIGFVALNPIWSELFPPFPILRVSPPITAPVDGPYYLQNAENGYKWDVKQPLSLWYHPLLPVLISAMPDWFPANIWFWLLSLAFAISSLVLTYCIITVYVGKVPPSFLLLVPLIPGGLEIATGNPEIPTLFFASLLLLSVIKWHNWCVTASASILAILTKPNALYLVPMLIVYAIAGYKSGDKKLFTHSIAGIALVILGWFAWVLFVDWKTGEWGAYWQARGGFAKYVAGDAASYFLELAKSFSYGVDLRDRVRYSTALIIPIVNLWVIASAPFSHNTHRYALTAGNLAMLALVFWQGNPNKVIVYTTTLPGYFATYVVFTHALMKIRTLRNRFHYVGVYTVYFSYLVLMLTVYVFGTPLGWYY